MMRVQGRRIVVALPLAALLAHGGAWAQGKGAVLPENPQSPTDFAGMPRRAAPAPAAKAAPAKGPVTGYSGGDMSVPTEKVRRRGPVPEYHTVKKGESLWRICDTYYSDPWAWPQLWAYNKSITNPHWIYPGDRIRMLGGSPQGGGEGPGPGIQARTRTYDDGTVQLKQLGYADEKVLKRTGKITGSKHMHKMLSLYHEVYIAGSKHFQPKRGERYSVFRTKRELRSEGKKLGYLVEILGTVRIKRSETKKKVAVGEIVEAFNVIERGDVVGPLRRQLKRASTRPAKRNLGGHVVDFLHDVKWSAKDQLVFLDRGKDHGVRLGNRFLVVRRGDPNTTLLQEGERDDKRFPNEAIAEVSVLDVQKHASVGLITRSIKEVRKGDKVRMRRGY